MTEQELKTLMGNPFQNEKTIDQLNAAIQYLAGCSTEAGSEESLRHIIRAICQTSYAIQSEYKADVHSWEECKRELLSENDKISGCEPTDNDKH